MTHTNFLNYSMLIDDGRLQSVDCKEQHSHDSQQETVLVSEQLQDLFAR